MRKLVNFLSKWFYAHYWSSMGLVCGLTMVSVVLGISNNTNKYLTICFGLAFGASLCAGDNFWHARSGYFPSPFYDPLRNHLTKKNSLNKYCEIRAKRATISLLVAILCLSLAIILLIVNKLHEIF